ncbi:hypothetical protein [Geopsychrobacter electrodiphilus]|uniref:hypothetical protein n=1 Tax=Geopsychrobacter electrodiphilus TaxID=225196 RepID=UPI0003793CC6|nr:hypothetical protein [Geopsychrobacter electrodiphilus]
MRKYIFLLICSLLAACAAGTHPKAGVEPESLIDLPQLRAGLSQLPGVLVSGTDPLTVRFPVGTLFATGSVLPMPGGPDMLDPMIRLMKDSHRTWQLTLRAKTGEGKAYDQSLADARLIVMQTYLKSSGVNSSNITFNAVAGEGAPLEMQLLQKGSTTDKGVKK